MTTASREERAPAMYQSDATLSKRTLGELRDQDQIQMELIKYIYINILLSTVI